MEGINKKLPRNQKIKDAICIMKNTVNQSFFKVVPKLSKFSKFSEDLLYANASRFLKCV